MDKKIPLIISTFIAAAGGLGWQALPVSAESINMDTGESIWTLDELTEIEKETDEYLLAQCGEDLGCQREQFYNLMESDPKYQILNSFQNHLILITSINPSQNTLKVYHQSRDDMTRWFGMNPDENLLTELRIGWSNLPDTPLIVYKEGYIPTDQTLLPEDFHFAYSADEFSHGRGWFPAREEVTINVADDMSHNTSNIMQYTMVSVFSNASGGFNYSSCINSPYYHPGMECKAVFSDKTSLTYLPYDGEILADTRFSKVVDGNDALIQDPTANTIVENNTDIGEQSNSPYNNISNVNSDHQEQEVHQQTTTQQENLSSSTTKSDIASVASSSNRTIQKDTESTLEPVSQTLSVVTITSSPQYQQTPRNKNITKSVSMHTTDTMADSVNDNLSTKPYNQPDDISKTQDASTKSSSAETYEVPLSGNNGEEKKFPWWIFALLCSGIGALVWWFVIPLRDNRQEKE